MTQYYAAWACTAAVVVCFSSAAAQESVPKDDFVQVSATTPFICTRVNGPIVGLYGATPKQIIEKLTPGLPIVGVRQLPSHVRFNIALSRTPPTPKILLARLGKKLGVGITIGDSRSDFLIVRNTNVPNSWERSSEATKEDIRLIDKRDGLYRATQTSVTSLVQFITDHDDRPVLNQCALQERYNFTFAFSDRNGLALLKSFGFDVKLENRTTNAVVVSKTKGPD
ncbi:MAG: hypothetical protein H8E66_04005 [Planctomycetes bacterium]|nr:hypothetical protein [Planctomycetota bacterium]